MKKIIIIFVIFAFALSGCSTGQNVADNGEQQTNESSELESPSTSSSSESQGIDVDNKLLTVDVTLPAEMAGDLSNFDEKKYLEENEGIKAAKVNEDGSLTLTMTKSKHKEMLEELKANIDESLGELIEGESTPYIKSIDYKKDYREIMVKVSREEYENSFDMTPFMLAFSAGMYQTIAGIEFDTVITISDAISGEVITSVAYPEALE